MFLISTEKETKIFKQTSYNLFLIAWAYSGAIEMTREHVGGLINPGFAAWIWTTMFMYGNEHAFKWLWLYISMPIAGSILALVTFELVYKRALEAIKSRN